MFATNTGRRLLYLCVREGAMRRSRNHPAMQFRQGRTGMPESQMEILQLVASGAIGYLLGAIPFAQWVSRYIKGVDIFSTGSTLAGTANVYWNVGRRSALLVFAGDVGKGSAAVAVAWALGIEAPLTLIAAAATIVGHWVSVFSSFRGGDAMTPLIGVSVALVPVLTVLATVVGVATVLLMRNHHLRSSWGICTGFMLMLGISLAYRHEVELVTGLSILAGLVLLRSLVVRRRINTGDHSADLDELDSDPDLSKEVSGN